MPIFSQFLDFMIFFLFSVASSSSPVTNINKDLSALAKDTLGQKFTTSNFTETIVVNSESVFGGDTIRTSGSNNQASSIASGSSSSSSSGNTNTTTVAKKRKVDNGKFSMANEDLNK